MSITGDIADVVLSVSYDRLSAETVEKTKRVIMDTLACAIGGFNSGTGVSCRTVAHEIGGVPQATIIGESKKVSLQAAVLANQAMIRYLDYNDDFSFHLGPGDLCSSHPSGALPVAFAVGEWVGATGAQVIEAIVAGYEAVGAVQSAFRTSLEVLKLHHSAVLAYGGVALAGKLLKLDANQLMHGMGIAGTQTLGLGILDAEGEEYVMTKNVIDGLSAERGMLGALLARRGVTGPERVIEGNKGLAEAVLGGRHMYQPQPPRNQPFIMTTVLKGVCAESTTHGHLKATAAIVRKHKLKPDDIREIRVRTAKRSVFHTGDPVKKYPRNKETADHSAYYLTAIAVLQGDITPKAYDDRLYGDAIVRSLIDKVTLEHGPEFDAIQPAGEVTITTRDGKVLHHRVDLDQLKGQPSNPMNDEDLRQKFQLCADGILSKARVRKIIEACMALDKSERFADLMPLLRVPKSRKSPSPPPRGPFAGDTPADPKGVERAG